MIFLKSPSDLNHLEYVNKIGAEFLYECYDFITDGIETIDIEKIALDFCKKYVVEPCFLGYERFPHAICVSINDEIIHGFPSHRRINNGDIVSIDFGVKKNGFVSDAAFTKLVGKTNKRAKNLVKATYESLLKGIEQAFAGNRLFNISSTIHKHALDCKFDVIRKYVGHGTGFFLHEDPKVPNYVGFGVNWRLRPGMVLAIEPMLVEGSYDYSIAPNSWTVLTADGKLSAHFEHSVAITESGPRILSKFNGIEPWAC